MTNSAITDLLYASQHKTDCASSTSMVATWEEANHVYRKD